MECITDPLPEVEEDLEIDECPNTFGLSFISSRTSCEEYYICFNGSPSLAKCKPGLHWNQERGYCGNPRLANCQV